MEGPNDASPEPESTRDPAPVPGDPEAWKLVYFGPLSRDLLPPHPGPAECQEDELTQAALTDPESATRGEREQRGPTFWRALAVVALALASLAFIFWLKR